MSVTFKTLDSRLWTDLETLFAERGACGGCWCMYWRQRKGEKWENVKGDINRRRMRKLVNFGQAHGVLAYADGVPVGWAAFERRTDLDKLNRAPSLKCSDAGEVWSVPCFFIATRFRKRGVASALLRQAVNVMRGLGARIIEGYPVRNKGSNRVISAAFAWTGTQSMFRKAGFKPVGPRTGGKQRMRFTP